MIYNESELLSILTEIRKHPETEVTEVKEARSSFAFNEIGQYFSALSNEANLHGKPEGWLVFGVADDMNIVGSNFRDNEKSLHDLKKEIRERTNLLQIMKTKDQIIDSRGKTSNTVWFLRK